MPDTGLGFLLASAARTTIVLLALVVGVRIFGKRQIGEMNTQDVLLILIMANAVQNAMTKGSGQLLVAIVSAGALILLGWIIATALYRWPALEPRLMGSPTVIVHNGQLIRHNLRDERLTIDEVLAAVRKQGLADLDDVKIAFLEMDGSISVVPRDRSGEGE